ncbi:MAG: redoxin domain-containing protein [Verrucomicrobiia bacterium]
MKTYVCLAAASLLLLGNIQNVLGQYDVGTTDFGNVTVGTTKSFSTTWDGGVSNGYEFVQSETINGADASDFSVNPNRAGTRLVAGLKNPFVLAFTPSHAGVETATINLSVLFPGSVVATYTYHLTGVGGAPAHVSSEPLDLKFKAVDGTDVDLAKFRGKVVLVDFWATWCGPCRMEIPNVVATYNQLHNAGFEIVGISLDQSKEKLLAYTKQAGMTWPQYFDGNGWANDISSRYGINSIPTAWLVDKKGLVRTTQARGADLARQVKALLAE